MESVFEALETVADKLSTAGNYLSGTRAAKWMFSTSLWNSLRKKVSETEHVDEILCVSDQCVYDIDTDCFCKHTVKYRYNGIVQEEQFDAQKILRLCKDAGYPLSSHFSMAELVSPVIDAARKELN